MVCVSFYTIFSSGEIQDFNYPPEKKAKKLEIADSEEKQSRKSSLKSEVDFKNSGFHGTELGDVPEKL